MAEKRQNNEANGTYKRMKNDCFRLNDITNSIVNNDDVATFSNDSERCSKGNSKIQNEDGYSKRQPDNPTTRQEYFESQYHDSTIAYQSKSLSRLFPGPAGFDRQTPKPSKEDNMAASVLCKGLEFMNETVLSSQKYTSIDNSSWKALKKQFNLSYRRKESLINKMNLKVILKKLKRWSYNDDRVPIPFLAAVIMDDYDLQTELSSETKPTSYSILLEDNKETITAVLHQDVVRDFGRLLCKGSSVVLQKALFHKIYGTPQLVITKEMLTCIVVNLKTTDSNLLNCFPNGLRREKIEDEIYCFHQNTFKEEIVNAEIIAFNSKVKSSSSTVKSIIKTNATLELNMDLNSNPLLTAEVEQEVEERLSGLLIGSHETNKPPAVNDNINSLNNQSLSLKQSIPTTSNIKADRNHKEGSNDFIASSSNVTVSKQNLSSKTPGFSSQMHNEFSSQDDFIFLDQSITNILDTYEKDDYEIDKNGDQSSTFINSKEAESSSNNQSTSIHPTNDFRSQDDCLFHDKSVSNIIDNYKKDVDENNKNVELSTNNVNVEDESLSKHQVTSTHSVDDFLSQDDCLFLDQSVSNIIDNYKKNLDDNDKKDEPSSTVVNTEEENLSKPQALSIEPCDEFKSQDDCLLLDQSVTNIIDNYNKVEDKNSRNNEPSTTVVNTEDENLSKPQALSIEPCDEFKSQDDCLLLDQSVTNIIDSYNKVENKTNKNNETSPTVDNIEVENLIKGQPSSNQPRHKLQEKDDCVFLKQNVSILVDCCEKDVDNDEVIVSSCVDSIPESEKLMKNQSSGSQMTNPFDDEDDYLFFDQSVSEIADSFQDKCIKTKNDL